LLVESPLLAPVGMAVEVDELCELEETTVVPFDPELEPDDEDEEAPLVLEVMGADEVAFPTTEGMVVAGAVPGTSVEKFWTMVA